LKPEEIESVLAEQADILAVSVAKLRAVYIRGVKESVFKGYDAPPHDCGLARVQRFALALTASNHRLTVDTDLLPKQPTNTPQTPNHSLELIGSPESWSLLLSTTQNNTNHLTELFPDLEEVSYDTERQLLTLDGSDWHCSIDLLKNEYSVSL